VNAEIGADSGSRASHRANSSVVSTKGFDPGEKWRPTLIAFYEKDELPTKARLLRDGAPFDYMDRRTIKALEAAFIVAAVNA
jgi:hypothetical protein